MGAAAILIKEGFQNELLHQLVLAPLLRHTNLASSFGVTRSLGNVRCVREAEGKLFDLGLYDAKERPLLLIELKTTTDLSKEQMMRQRRWVEKLSKSRGAYPVVVYLLIGPTGIGWTEADVVWQLKDARANKRGDYRIITTERLLPLVRSIAKAARGGIRVLARDYARGLAEWLQNVGSYPSVPYERWDGPKHFQFFSDVRKRLPRDLQRSFNFGYVPNPKGGFFGCWWDWWDFARLSHQGSHAYLQCEFGEGALGGALKFKIAVGRARGRTSTRDRFSQAILSAAGALGVRAREPDRLGHGRSMTVAVLEDSDLRSFRLSGERMDWKRIKRTVSSASRVLERAVTKYKWSSRASCQ